jgi:hypothetical protein
MKLLDDLHIVEEFHKKAESKSDFINLFLILTTTKLSCLNLCAEY